MGCNKICRMAGCSNPVIDCGEKYCSECLPYAEAEVDSTEKEGDALSKTNMSQVN